jgi:hypothetical protein
MTTADTMRLREQLLAELRESGRPLSTSELAERMPWKVERRDEGCGALCRRTTPNPDVKVVACHSSWHVVAYRRSAHGYTGIYRHLRSLERHGLARRALRDGRKRVSWVYTGADRPTAPARESSRGERISDG